MLELYCFKQKKMQVYFNQKHNIKNILKVDLVYKKYFTLNLCI